MAHPKVAMTLALLVAAIGPAPLLSFARCAPFARFLGTAHAEEAIGVEAPRRQPSLRRPRKAIAVTQDQPIEPSTAPTRAAPPRRAESIVHPYKGVNTTLIGVGMLTLGAAYGGAAIVGGTSDHPGDSHLFVPVAGPWLDLLDRGDCGRDPTLHCEDEGTNKVLLTADGIFQGLGALAIVAGLFSSETRELVATTGMLNTPSARARDIVQVRVLPMRFGWSAYGVGVVGVTTAF